MFCQRVILLFILSLIFHDARAKMANSDIAEILHRPIRSLTFPKNSNMGIFVALSVPLEDPLNSISLSYFFEANYSLPPNITYFEPWTEGKKRRRSIDRTTIYRVLESKFVSSGYPGRECLLRAICETSEFPLQHNGIIGDIMHVVFSSLSADTQMHYQAYAFARRFFGQFTEKIAIALQRRLHYNLQWNLLESKYFEARGIAARYCRGRTSRPQWKLFQVPTAMPVGTLRLDWSPRVILEKSSQFTMPLSQNKHSNWQPLEIVHVLPKIECNMFL